MKVHTSNYQIQGFTHAVTEAELVTLGEERQLPVITDPGSGRVLLFNSKKRGKHRPDYLVWLHLPDFRPRFNPQEDQLWQQIGPLFSDQSLWVRDTATATHQDEEVIRSLLLTAARLGHITAIVRDRYCHSDQVQIFADLIRQRAAQGGSTSAADFRNQLGIGRKIAVQILEFFDRSGFTRRRGNEHLLRDDRLFNPAATA